MMRVEQLVVEGRGQSLPLLSFNGSYVDCRVVCLTSVELELWASTEENVSSKRPETKVAMGKIW